MKLIDGEELLNKVNKIKYLRKLKAKELVSECEQIEAIPIKWLEDNKDWLDNLYLCEDKIEGLIQEFRNDITD